MRITVFGSGGVGGYFGARLAQGGCDVGFVARGEHLRALRERGLRVRSALGDVALASVRASDDPAALGEADFVLVCTKLWDLDDSVRAIAPAVGPRTAVISFQNGVTKDDVLRRAFGEKAVVGGVAYISAGIAEPGVIRHTGKLAKLVFGEYGGARSPRVEALLEACLRGGIDAAIAPDVRLAIWEKFVFLVGMSAATAGTRSTIGPVRENPRPRALLLDVMREVVAVGRALGVPLAEDFADNRLAFIDGLPREMEASMATDLRNGRRLELAWLSGAVAELGASARVATPMNRAVADLLAIHAEGTVAAQTT
jgi:2-dehydropantoate 2-reductase